MAWKLFYAYLYFHFFPKYPLAVFEVEICTCTLKPGSHWRHKHKHKIDTKTKHDLSSGTCKHVAQNVADLIAWEDQTPSQARELRPRLRGGLIFSGYRFDCIPLFCLLFVLMLISLVWTRLKPRAEQKTKQRKILVVLYLQVPEDKSCVVFVSISYEAPGVKQLFNKFC